MQIVLTEQNGKNSYEVSEEFAEIIEALKSKYKIYYICSGDYIFRIAIKKDNLWICVSFDKFSWETDAYAVGTDISASCGSYREADVIRLIDDFDTSEEGNIHSFFEWIRKNGWVVKENKSLD